MNDMTLFNSLFDDLLCGTTARPVYPVWNTNCAAPKVDVMEQKDRYILEMELPGRTENDVNIELENDNLVISSIKNVSKDSKENETKKEEKYLLRERSNADFTRKFIIPDNADYDGINATFKNGILTITVMKKENAEPKKIQITAA
jgi:HSP20 family protein